MPERHHEHLILPHDEVSCVRESVEHEPTDDLAPGDEGPGGRALRDGGEHPIGLDQNVVSEPIALLLVSRGRELRSGLVDEDDLHPRFG